MLHLVVGDISERSCNDLLEGVVLGKQVVDHDPFDQIISELHLISLNSPEQIVNCSKICNEISTFSHLQSEDLSEELVPAYTLSNVKELLETFYHFSKTFKVFDGVVDIGM